MIKQPTVLVQSTMDCSADLHWFVAILVFESSLNERWDDPSVDIQFRLIRAVDANSAYIRARMLGREGEHSYQNPYGETCVWSFKGLQDLQQVDVDSLVDGVEIYRFIEPAAADDYVVEWDQLTAFCTGEIE